MGHAWSPIDCPDPAELARRYPRSSHMQALQSLWSRQRAELQQRAAWRPFWERTVRWWSIETGVIEGIFDVSKGVTHTLVEHGLLASLIPHGEANRPAEEIIRILGDHRDALEMVMDVVGQARDVSVGWIRELHALLCAHQPSTQGVDQFGRAVAIPLPRGEYKRRPNHVILPDGTEHQYCPPEQVASEMERLVDTWRRLPPELPEARAAWLHHAFTQIHPFEDGNGRVARTLASIDMIRSGLFPLVVDREQRDTRYLPALRAADAGDLGPLIQFFGECQERIVLRALSDARLTVDQITGVDDAIDAARRKLLARGLKVQEGKARMEQRLERLVEQARRSLEPEARKIEQGVEGVRASVQTSTPDKEHWFRAQVVELARRHGYWADLRELRRWARLHLRDGGVTDMVIVWHFIGNPSPGSAVAAVFVQHRALKSSDEDGVTSPSTIPLDIEPLTLFPDEDEAQQQQRFQDWLLGALKRALAVWVRLL